MPMYEYDCHKCKKPFEKLVRSMSKSDAKVECPACGSTQTTRKLSVVAVGSATTRSEAAAPQGGGCGRCQMPGGCEFPG
jgi:putative FmdB family regulatory protein